MEEPEPNTANEETSEAEDLLLSDAEDTQTLDQDITLRIDYNARLVTKEDKLENGGDDCDMHFVEKNSLLGRRVSEAGFHTSTEDLNVSEDEGESCRLLTLKSVNLDGIASSSKNAAGSLSTLNYSHSVFKNQYSVDAEYISDDEISNNMKEEGIRKGKYKSLAPGLTVAGLSCAIKTASSIVFPTTQKALDIKNAFTSSLLLDENVPDAQDGQGSPPMTCLEFLKSEFSDGNNTDAEDISVGSLDDVGTSKKDRNLLEKDCNALNIPVSLKNGYHGDSRRSSAAGFNTEDEIFSMEKIPDHCQKRVKKRNFRIVDKREVSDDSGTDEEIL